MIHARIIEFKLGLFSVLEVSRPTRNENVVIAFILHLSPILNKAAPCDFFDLCPICLLNGEADTDIHHDVRHLHQDY